MTFTEIRYRMCENNRKRKAEIKERKKKRQYEKQKKRAKALYFHKREIKKYETC
jgi:hypothetical protein